MISKIKSIGVKGKYGIIDYEIFEIINIKNNLKGLGVFLYSGSDLLGWSEIQEERNEVRFYSDSGKIIDEFEIILLKNLVEKYKKDYPHYLIKENFTPSISH